MKALWVVSIFLLLWSGCIIPDLSFYEYCEQSGAVAKRFSSKHPRVLVYRESDKRLWGCEWRRISKSELAELGISEEMLSVELETQTQSLEEALADPLVSEEEKKSIRAVIRALDL